MKAELTVYVNSAFFICANMCNKEKPKNRRPLLKATAWVVVGVFLFNAVFIDLSWAEEESLRVLRLLEVKKGTTKRSKAFNTAFAIPASKIPSLYGVQSPYNYTPYGYSRTSPTGNTRIVSKEVFDRLLDLRHDVRSDLTPMLKSGLSIYERNDCLTPELIQLRKLAIEISDELDNIPKPGQSSRELEEFLEKLKRLAEKAQNSFHYLATRPIVEQAYEWLPQEVRDRRYRFSDRLKNVTAKIIHVDLKIKGLFAASCALSNFLFEKKIGITEVALHALLDTVSPVSIKKYDKENIIISTDEAALVRAIVNISHNAEQAIGRNAGGDFTIGTILNEKEGYVEIILSDTAGGIPQDILPRIFERGFSTYVGKHKGLGLDIARGCIEKGCGGTITVDSRHISEYPEDHGTTFTIHLPAHTSPIEQLINNPWMENFCHRLEDYGAEKNYITEFLAPNHPLKVEVFSEIDKLSDEEVLKRAEECLTITAAEENNFYGFGYSSYAHHLGRHLMLRELFLYPTVGVTDLPQVLQASLLSYVSPKSIEWHIGLGDTSRAIMKMRLKKIYLLIKAMEILSRKSDLVLIQESDVHSLAKYLTYGSISGGAGETHNLLLLADLLVPADTPQKQTSLRNLLTLVNRLKQADKRWAEVFAIPENRTKIQALETLHTSPTTMFPTPAPLLDMDYLNDVLEATRSRLDKA